MEHAHICPSTAEALQQQIANDSGEPSMADAASLPQWRPQGRAAAGGPAAERCAGHAAAALSAAPAGLPPPPSPSLQPPAKRANPCQEHQDATFDSSSLPRAHPCVRVALVVRCSPSSRNRQARRSDRASPSLIHRAGHGSSASCRYNHQLCPANLSPSADINRAGNTRRSLTASWAGAGVTGSSAVRRYTAPPCAAAHQAAGGVGASACSRRSASASAVAEGGRCTAQNASSSARSLDRASTQPAQEVLMLGTR